MIRVLSAKSFLRTCITQYDSSPVGFLLQSVDPLLAYLDTNLQVLYERLEASTFPHMMCHLWTATLECFRDTLMEGVSTFVTHVLVNFGPVLWANVPYRVTRNKN